MLQRRWGLGWLSGAILSSAILMGCSGGDSDTKPTAKVSGTVTYEGQPVTGGLLMFSPIGDDKGNKPGKTGQATIKSDGTFASVATYGDSDGAVVGKHRLLFSPPNPEAPAAGADGGHAQAPPASPFAGLVPKEPEITVNKGDNKLTVELVKGTPVQN